MRSFKQVEDDKHTFTLDNRQVAFLAVGALGLLLLFFLLGVLYGSRLQVPVAAEPAETPAEEPLPPAGEEGETSLGLTEEEPAAPDRPRERVFELTGEPIGAGEGAEDSARMAEAPPPPPAPEPRKPAPAAAPPPPPREAPPRAGSEPGQASIRPAPGEYTIQVGSFTESADARSLAGRLADKGYRTYVVSGDVNGRTYYRVRFGRFRSREEATRQAERFKQSQKMDAYATRVE